MCAHTDSLRRGQKTNAGALLLLTSCPSKSPTTSKPITRDTNYESDANENKQINKDCPNAHSDEQKIIIFN